MMPAAPTTCNARHHQASSGETRGLTVKVRSDSAEEVLEARVSSVIPAEKISVQLWVRKL
jgi:hypothetical protein